MNNMLCKVFRSIGLILCSSPGLSHNREVARSVTNEATSMNSKEEGIKEIIIEDYLLMHTGMTTEVDFYAAVVTLSTLFKLLASNHAPATGEQENGGADSPV